VVVSTNKKLLVRTEESFRRDRHSTIGDSRMRLTSDGRLPHTTYGLEKYLREAVKLVLNHRGQRRSIIRAWIYDALRLYTPIVAVEGRNAMRFCVSTSELIGRCLYSNKYFEEHTMATASDVIQTLRGGPPPLRGRRFIDVGANIGTASITAINVFEADTAIGFEPAADNFKLLQCNIIMNDLSSRVRTFQVALSNSSGAAMLELSHDNSGDHRVRVNSINGYGMLGESERPTSRIQIARFDEFIAEHDIGVQDVGMVWIDTQGHEGHVLEGAAAVLESNIPVVLEYWPYALRRAGGLNLLHSLIAENYSNVIDLSIPRGTPTYRAQDVHKLETEYPDLRETDLLLLK
jgi:FkbM family methyltransferase